MADRMKGMGRARSVRQDGSSATSVRGGDILILHSVGGHENFYRDLKAK
jgi:hypothetical protein